MVTTIPGHRVQLQVARERTQAGAVSHSVSLFPEPCGYAQHTDGAWHVWPPNGRNVRLGSEHAVEVHADGTITVTGPAFATASGVWSLVAGQWVPGIAR